MAGAVSRCGFIPLAATSLSLSLFKTHCESLRVASCAQANSRLTPELQPCNTDVDLTVEVALRTPPGSDPQELKQSENLRDNYIKVGRHCGRLGWKTPEGLAEQVRES